MFLLLSAIKGNFPSGCRPMAFSVPEPQDPTVSPREGIGSALQFLMLFSCERHPNQDEPAAPKHEKLSQWSFSPGGPGETLALGKWKSLEVLQGEVASPASAGGRGANNPIPQNRLAPDRQSSDSEEKGLGTTRDALRASRVRTL